MVHRTNIKINNIHNNTHNKMVQVYKRKEDNFRDG